MAPVGHTWFSAPVFNPFGSGSKYPVHNRQYPHIGYACTHFTAEGVSTQLVAQFVHAMHLKGSICQTVRSFCVCRAIKVVAAPSKNRKAPRKPLPKNVRRFAAGLLVIPACGSVGF
jgi:hypothetical protein